MHMRGRRRYLNKPDQLCDKQSWKRSSVKMNSAWMPTSRKSSLEHQEAYRPASHYIAASPTYPSSVSTLYVAFDAGDGIWKWDGTTWSQITTGFPEAMAASALALYVDFGTGRASPEYFRGSEPDRHPHGLPAPIRPQPSRRPPQRRGGWRRCCP